MVKDPVTGIANNLTSKNKKKPAKREIKVSQQQAFVDLRPLEQFQSKLITRNRITVFIPTTKT